MFRAGWLFVCLFVCLFLCFYQLRAVCWSTDGDKDIRYSEISSMGHRKHATGLHLWFDASASSSNCFLQSMSFSSRLANRSFTDLRMHKGEGFEAIDHSKDLSGFVKRVARAWANLRAQREGGRVWNKVKHTWRSECDSLEAREAGASEHAHK